MGRRGALLGGLLNLLAGVFLGLPLGGLLGFLAGLLLRLPLGGLPGFALGLGLGAPLGGLLGFALGLGLGRRWEEFDIDGDYRLAGGSFEVKGSVQDARVSGVDRDVKSLGRLVHPDPVM
jgi:hypothetical protein